MRRIALFAAASWLCPALLSAQSAPAPSVGQIAFANSGAPQAQPALQRGVALLHNFEYPRALAAFQEAQKANPGLAMAYWGEAMAHNHAVWMEQDADKGRAALRKLGATPAERLTKAQTERERGYLAAVEALYGDGSKEQRDFAYSAAMEKVFQAHPSDVDAASFFALSLLGLAHSGRDYAKYMRAAVILEEFYPANRSHPGVLHYMIHSYDDPTHAPLGLRAARLYGAVAPDAPHAIHMTSHIFIAMGDWTQTIAANEAAAAASQRLRLAEGKAAQRCGHVLEWLNYAYYQVGRPERSEAIRTGCHGAAVGYLAGPPPPNVPSPALSYADMWVRRIAETGERPSDPRLSRVAANSSEAFTFAYGSLLLARGNPAKLTSAHRLLNRIASATKSPGLHASVSRRQAIVLAQAAGLAALASGRRNAGLGELRRAAELERAMAPEFGPPAIEKPSFELLGEELLAAGKPAEAAEAFRQALTLAPGRKLSSAGLRLAGSKAPAGVATIATASHTH